MNISLRGLLLENLTEAKISHFIRGFCIANIICFSYYTALILTSPSKIPEVVFEPVTEDVEKSEQKLTLGEYEFIITRRNIFSSSDLPTEISKDNTLPIRLVGTSCLYRAGIKSSCFAIIEDRRTEMQDLFELNTYPFNIGKLIEIASEYIDIVNNHNRYRLYIDDELSQDQNNLQEIEKTIETNKTTGKKRFDGITEVSFRNYEIKRELVEEVLGDLDRHLSTGYSKKTDDGILIYGLSRFSIFKELGITNYDVVTKINGKPLNSITGAKEVFDTFIAEGVENLEVLEITVKRAGLEVPLKYSVVE